MKYFNIFVILLVGNLKFSECIDCSGEPKNTEIRLRRKLLCSYDKDTRPMGDSKNGTLITVRMYLKSFDYAEYSGRMELSTWMGMRWTDSNLKWEPSEYDGIRTLTIHSDEIWMPDLAIYNSRYRSDDTIITPGETLIESTQFSEACSAAHCVLYSSGSVACSPPCLHSGSCHGIYKDWPYDIQNCTLHFGSWMHKGSEITYRAERIRIDSEAMTHNEWQIVEMSYENIPGNYSCCPNETYPNIRVNIAIQRHAVAETATVVAPAIVVTVINLAGLWINPSCTERLILNAISLLSHFMFQQQLSWLVPKNGDDLPKALIFYRDSMIISTILLLQTIVLRGMISNTSATPSWIKSVTDSLRGNRVGQLMFTNPYLVNKGTPLNNEDSSSLVEEQPITENSNQQQKFSDTTNNVWTTFVRVFDSLMFLALFICYLVLLVGWLPSGQRFPNGIKDEIVQTD